MAVGGLGVSVGGMGVLVGGAGVTVGAGVGVSGTAVPQAAKRASNRHPIRNRFRNRLVLIDTSVLGRAALCL